MTRAFLTAAAKKGAAVIYTRLFSSETWFQLPVVRALILKRESVEGCRMLLKGLFQPFSGLQFLKRHFIEKAPTASTATVI
jgi:hypothetical protein